MNKTSVLYLRSGTTKRKITRPVGSKNTGTHPDFPNNFVKMSALPRVERISTSTLVVGIDIDKEKHAAQAVNFRGIVLTDHASCSRTPEVGLNT